MEEWSSALELDGEHQQHFSAVEGEYTCLVASHQEGRGQVLCHEVQPKINVLLLFMSCEIRTKIDVVKGLGITEVKNGQTYQVR